MNPFYSRMSFDDVRYVNDMLNQYCENDIEIYNIYDFVDKCSDLTMVSRNENYDIVGAIFGFITNGTCITKNKIEEGHIDHGDTLCVISECVKHDMIDTVIMEDIRTYYYDEWILNHKNRKHRTIKYISSIARQSNLNSMKTLGFEVIGPSKLKWGEEELFDVVKRL